MKTILEHFLDALETDYTRHFANALYQEHPHKYNMYGLKRMLDVYGIKSLGINVNSKDLEELTYPCILHIHGDFVIGLKCDGDTVTYLHHGKKTTGTIDEVRRMWTGNALVVEETTEAAEPDYKEHQRDGLISMAKTYSIPIMLILAAAVGIANNISAVGIFGIIRIALNLAGVLVCTMLMEKQLFGESSYGDRVCSMFHHADCNSVLDGPMAKVFGISWSEIGFGYFVANILLLSLYPESSGFVAAANWLAMIYGVWSIYYQWRVARSWCVLCIIVQVIIWAMGTAAFISCLAVSCFPGFTSSLLSCIVFAASIMGVHLFAVANVTEKERAHAIQQYRALKADGDVAKALFEKSEYYETSLSDSSIIFGNPNAKIRITILSNPHCNPCARMHERVEKLLVMEENGICVQYIFSSFNDELGDSSRYLIFCYLNNSKDKALYKFAQWYAKDKFNYKTVIAREEELIHTEMIEEEMEKHRMWRERTSLTATPTILVNGYKLPDEYELEDVAMIVDKDITEKNIMQDINGRSTTPLGADSRTAEETV